MEPPSPTTSEAEEVEKAAPTEAVEAAEEEKVDEPVILRVGGLSDIDPASIDLEFSCWPSETGGLNESGYFNEELDNLVYGYWYAGDSEAGWESMWQAQEILNQDRPRIIQAGENHIQAYQSDRFEFPHDTCPTGSGMWNLPAVLDIVVK